MSLTYEIISNIFIAYPRYILASCKVSNMRKPFIYLTSRDIFLCSNSTYNIIFTRNQPTFSARWLGGKRTDLEAKWHSEISTGLLSWKTVHCTFLHWRHHCLGRFSINSHVLWNRWDYTFQPMSWSAAFLNHYSASLCLFCLFRKKRKLFKIFNYSIFLLS